jgi:uncharacterized protein YcnI
MKKFIWKIQMVSVFTFLGVILFASFASAHVTVNPQSSSTGAWETYTVKVPVEKDIATTKFTLKMPSGVQFMSYQPASGWKFSSEKNSKDEVTSITFEATDQGIMPGQFQQFVYVAKNPDKEEKAAWDAYQYYKDGSIVEWTGAEGDKTPHSITNIVTAGTSDDHHTSSNTATTKEDSKSTDNIQNTTQSTYSTVPLVLSIISVLLSAGVLFLVVRKR